jgi:hypothetical protein
MLSKVIVPAMHKCNLCQHIKKHANWSDAIFDKVDWSAHYQAFTSFKRPQRISISKLAHGLYYRNKEANKMYGRTSICPCCDSNEETFCHIFHYPDAGVVSNSKDAQSKLKDDLLSSKTPEKLVDVLLHGIQSWTDWFNGGNIVPL